MNNSSRVSYGLVAIFLSGCGGAAQRVSESPNQSTSGASQGGAILEIDALARSVDASLNGMEHVSHIVEGIATEGASVGIFHQRGTIKKLQVDGLYETGASSESHYFGRNGELVLIHKEMRRYKLNYMEWGEEKPALMVVQDRDVFWLKDKELVRWLNDSGDVAASSQRFVEKKKSFASAPFIEGTHVINGDVIRVVTDSGKSLKKGSVRYTRAEAGIENQTYVDWVERVYFRGGEVLGYQENGAAVAGDSAKLLDVRVRAAYGLTDVLLKYFSATTGRAELGELHRNEDEAGHRKKLDAENWGDLFRAHKPVTPVLHGASLVLDRLAAMRRP